MLVRQSLRSTACGLVGRRRPGVKCRTRQSLIPLLCNRDREGHGRFGADHSRDVALACEVFCQIDAAESERDLGAVDELNLAAAAQRDDVLAAGCDVPISHTAWRCTTNLEPRTRL